MVGAMTWIEDLRTWEDFGKRSWPRVLSATLGGAPGALCVEDGLSCLAVRAGLRLGGKPFRNGLQAALKPL